MVNTETKKTILVQAPIGTRSGYGAHSRDICIALIKSNLYDVKILPTPWGSTPNNALDAYDKDHALIIERLLNQPLSYTPDIFIQITIPNEFQRKGKFNVGITAGIETTVMAHDWVIGANKMDLVITTSEHSKKGFFESVYNGKDEHGNIKETVKFLKPIDVLFEGIDTSIYTNKVSIDSDNKLVKTLNDISEDFVFLHVGQWIQGVLGGDRKDIGMLVKVFCDTFRMKPPSTRPALLLKSNGANFSIGDKLEIESKLQSIFEQYGGKRPNVYLLHGDCTDVEMNLLYNHPKIKCMVSFTHGEGFGRPLLEFTQSGKPVMCSNWSGPVDFLNEKYSVLLPGELTQVHPSAVNKWIIKEAQWFTVDYNKAAQHLYDMYVNYNTYLDKSKIQMNIASRNFSLQKMQEKLVEILSTPVKTEVQTVSTNLPKLKRI